MTRHLRIVLTGFAVGMFFCYFLSFEGAFHWRDILLSGLAGVLISYLFHGINLLLNRWIGWKQRTGIRLLLGMLAHTAAGMGLVVLLMEGYQNYLGGETPSHMFLKIGVLLFCVVLLYNVIYFTFYSYQLYAKGQLEKVRLEREQTALQLRALKSQLSPHFLFNCLNTLSALIRTDVQNAEVFIRALAKSYRYPLRSYRQTLVPLKEELEFAKAYFFLMKTRFQEDIQFNVTVDEKYLESKTAPLTVQMLVENALKHNRTDVDTPLAIEINSDETHLTVSNTKTRPRANVTSTHIGLKNIDMRYYLLSGKHIEVENEQRFSVKLPLL
ncbi:MAG: histidine kinase [Bacteroidota bacterium]